jgi:hypothetical protein
MTFQKTCRFCIVCIVLACCTLVFVFAGVLSSQTQFSASIPANTINVPVTLANPVYYNETVAAVGVSTHSGALNCSTHTPNLLPLQARRRARTGRNCNDVPDTSGIKPASGAMAVTKRDRTAPTAKLPAHAHAA